MKDHTEIVKEQESDGPEKRVFSRVRCLVDLEVRGEAVGETVEAVDLSLLGVGFQRHKDEPEIEPGATLTVGMQGLKPLKGKVRWNHGSRVGVQFCGRFHDIVESWVGEVLAAQGVKIQDLFSNN